MNLSRSFVLFLGLAFGLLMIYFNAKTFSDFTNEKPKLKLSAEDNSIGQIPSQPSKMVYLHNNKSNTEDNSRSLKDAVIDQGLKPSEKKDKKPFNSKTDIKFKVIEGFAVASEDILLGQPLDKTQTSGHTFYNEEVRIWPNAEIPFAFDAKLSPELRTKVIQALDVFSKKTSVQFLEYDGLQKDFIVFSPSESLCASYVGRVGGAQPILLKPSCEVSEIQHEIMHVLGFIHEHQREIRDSHLLVFEQNIIPEKLINFEVLPTPFQNIYRNISLDIDYESLMIYPSKAFVKSTELYSIKIKDKEEEIKNNRFLSDGDIENINNLYFRKF